MAKVTTPHFDYPFRFAEGGSAMVVEQDSEEEILVAAGHIVRTPLGWRLELPDFGVSDQVLIGEPSKEEIHTALDMWEPRARFTVEVEYDENDTNVYKVQIGVAEVTDA